MTPYVACYAILVMSLGMGLLLDKLRIAAILAFIPMFLLIALRGLVGTDSAIYVQIFDVIRYQGIFASSFEPGFTILVEVLSWFFSDSFDILIVLGCTTAVIVLIAGLLLERVPLFFMIIVLPYFLIDMSMNGLRYGLAFAIVALGAAALARGWLKTFIVCSIIAASIQISSVLLAASLWVLMEARIRIFLAAGGGLIVAFILFGDYLGNKLSQNADVSGIGGLSGVAPLVATMLVIAAVRVSVSNGVAGQERSVSNAVLLCVLAMQLAAFFIARQYYAGLRLQSLFLFLLYIVITAVEKKNAYDKKMNIRSIIILLMSFLIMSGSRLRNFNDDTMYLSPFNPYYFAGELSV